MKTQSEIEQLANDYLFDRYVVKNSESQKVGKAYFDGFSDCQNNDNWISVKDELPNLLENLPIYEKTIGVIACWGFSNKNTAEMEYKEVIVGGEKIRRFYWNGRISPWQVLFWQPLPQPPKQIGGSNE